VSSVWWGEKKTTWKKEFEETYRPDSTLETRLTSLSGGGVETLRFSTSGVKVSKAVQTTWELTTEYYEDDGRTVAKATEQTSYKVDVFTYKQGVMRERLEFWSQFQMFDDTTYDDQGHQQMMWSWRAISVDDLRTDGKIDPNKYKLISLEYAGKNGMDVKTIQFQDDGVNPKVVRVRPSPFQTTQYPLTVREFDATGALTTETVIDGDGKSTVTQHTAAENIRETIDPADVAKRQFDSPPQMFTPTWR
jgi:hypothetical protein